MNNIVVTDEIRMLMAARELRIDNMVPLLLSSPLFLTGAELGSRLGLLDEDDDG